MKTLYFDCFSGASGNMILGGLIALGVSPERLTLEVSKLGISDFELNIQRVTRSGVSAYHVETIYQEEIEHRNLSHIKDIISGSGLNDETKERSVAIFSNLADAEAKVHGIDVESVHFHEVGAMDAIIDVVGSCIGFELLEIERFVCSEIHLGSGFIEIAHGKYPVPPPAVSELLRGVPVYSTEIKGELITPTGAAIIRTVCTEFGQLNEITPELTGYGAGTRDIERFPNVLRMVVGDSREESGLSTEQLSLIESNLDDCTGETLGHVMNEAMSAGALDCWFTPIQMKKNRPGVLISILCRNAEKENLKKLLYNETSAIGVRTQTVSRECLERELLTIESKYGSIDLKIATYEGRVVNVKPEFDQVQAAAKYAGITVAEVVNEISEICTETYKGARFVGSR